jgi:hypothetical protein
MGMNGRLGGGREVKKKEKKEGRTRRVRLNSQVFTKTVGLSFFIFVDDF